MGKAAKKNIKSFLKSNKIQKKHKNGNNGNGFLKSQKKEILNKYNNNNNNNNQKNQFTDNDNNVNNKDDEINDEINGEINEINDNSKYIGERNEKGLKHGKGKLIIDDGNVILSGQWINDEIVGEGKYKTKELVLKGVFGTDGTLNGIVKEYDREIKNKLVFEGIYKEGVRNGKGTLFNDDGSQFRGTWSNGELTNGHGIYKFPDQRFTIEGQWLENGTILKGKYRINADEAINDNKELLEYYKSLPKKVKEFPIRLDQSTNEIISSDPLMIDIYENYYCYVKESSIPNSGEGLFARVDIPENTVVSFYNGIRLSHETVNSRSWDLNSNTISLNDHIVIDVPLELSLLSTYCSTISHKANHSFEKKNAQYFYYNHPRFGEIKSIKSIKPIKKDDEIFVTYDYTDEKPNWYN